MNREFTAYGVDGCKTGWFWIALTPSNKVAWGIEETIASLVARAAESDRIFIDIPIGLPNGPGERLCDKEAREKLGQPRGSSVFPAPARPVLQAKGYPEANRISENTIGKGYPGRLSRSRPRSGKWTNCFNPPQKRAASSARCIRKFASGRLPGANP